MSAISMEVSAMRLVSQYLHHYGRTRDTDFSRLADRDISEVVVQEPDADIG